MKYFFETYGCQMNVADSTALETMCNERGWTSAEQLEDAQLVLINTCSVRETAETRAWSRLQLMASLKKKHNFKVVLTGCMAERYKEKAQAKIPGIDYVMGHFQRQNFKQVLEAVEEGRSLDAIDEAAHFLFAPSHYAKGSFKTELPIMHGCNHFCTYCIVPYVRGREISRAPQEVYTELDVLNANNVKEVVLLGQNVNSYNFKQGDSPISFPQLVRGIGEHIRKNNLHSIQWLRFLSSHPKDLPLELIESLRDEPLFCRHIHLCVQAGSDRVLQFMNRQYTAKYFLELVEKMRHHIPGITFSTDILVGFPSETEAEFQETLKLMEEVQFTHAFMYYFNPREGTPAAKYFAQIDLATKKERLARVIDLQHKITDTYLEGLRNTTNQVLIETLSRRNPGEVLARTQSDAQVVFQAPSERVGTFATVKITDIKGKTLRAEEI